MKIPFLSAKNGTATESGSLAIKGETKNLTKLEKELKTISVFSEVKKEKDQLVAMIVESTDRNKKPYKYIQFTFTPGSAEVFFTNPPEVPNPTIRRLEVTKSFFSVLSLLESNGVFVPDRKELYEKTMDAFEIRESFVSSDVQRMKYDLDKARLENSRYKEELTRLKNEKESLTHELLGLEKKTQLLEDRVRKLESLTDNEIDQNILKWVEEHDGSLNEGKFCDTYGINAQRLEERLDALSKKGVIRIV